MSTEVKFRGGTTLEHSAFIGANREMTIDTDKHTVRVHDGVTPGGNALSRAGSLGRIDLGIVNHEKLNINDLGQIDQTLDVAGEINVSGDIIASGFLKGDGSQIENIPHDAADILRWIFIDSEFQPITPQSSEDTPVNWSNTIPAAYTDTIWVSFGIKTQGVGSFQWDVPVPISGKDGQNGTLWHSGSGAPQDALGINGDFYLDVTDEKIYKKTNGSWAISIDQLKGADGSPPDNYNFIFKVQESKPEKPDNSTDLPTGWLDDSPDIYTSTLWAVVGVMYSGTNEWVWGNPFQLTGTTGDKGSSIYPIYAEDAYGTGPSLIQGSRTYVNFYESSTIISDSDLATGGSVDIASLTFVKIAGGNIYPIYAEDANGTNASLIPSQTRRWVNFYESDTSITDLSLINTSALTYIEYIGMDGSHGKSTYTYYVYKRSATELTAADKPSGGKFDFGANGAIGSPTGWSNSIEETTGDDQLWSSRALAHIDGSTGTWDADNETSNPWSTPIKGAQDGQNATSKYYWQVYKRSTSIPPKPGAGAEFNFGDNTSQLPSGGWSNDIPSVADGVVYSSYAIAHITGATATWIANNETDPWSTPTHFLRDGADGAPGKTVAQLSIYYRGTTPPNVEEDGSAGTPTGGSYNFNTNTLTAPSTPTQWSTGIPSGTGPLWHSISNVVSTNANSSGEVTPVWSNGEKLTGNDGSMGKSTYMWHVYKRSNTALDTLNNSGQSIYAPSGGQFNFATNSGELPVDNVNSLGWVNSPADLDDAADLGQLWVSRALASADGAEGIDANLDWSTPIKGALDGINGTSTYMYQVYKRSTTALDDTDKPTNGEFNFTTNTGTAPTGWSNTIPIGDGAVYVSRALAHVIGATGTWIASDYVSGTDNPWSTPDKLVQDGVNGYNGEAGRTNVSGYVYYSVGFDGDFTGTNPTATNYSIDAGAFTGLTANWSTTPIINLDPTKKYYVSRFSGTESSTGSGEVTSLTFSTPFTHYNFDGLVSFTNSAVSTGTSGMLTTSSDLASQINNNATTIDGGKITTGSITANELSSTAINTGMLNSIDLDYGEFAMGDGTTMLGGWPAVGVFKSPGMLDGLYNAVGVAGVGTGHGGVGVGGTIFVEEEYNYSSNIQRSLNMGGAFISNYKRNSDPAKDVGTRVSSAYLGTTGHGGGFMSMNFITGTQSGTTFTPFTDEADAASAAAGDTVNKIAGIPGAAYWQIDPTNNYGAPHHASMTLVFQKKFYKRSNTEPLSPTEGAVSHNNTAQIQDLIDKALTHNNHSGYTLIDAVTNPTFSGLNNGWSTTVPGGSGQLWTCIISFGLGSESYGGFKTALESFRDNGTLELTTGWSLPVTKSETGAYDSSEDFNRYHLTRYAGAWIGKNGGGRCWAISTVGDVMVHGSTYIELNLKVDGTVYPFTGGHVGLIEKNFVVDRGDIIIDGDILLKSEDDYNNGITSVTASSKTNQKGAVGVYNDTTEWDRTLVPAFLYEEVSDEDEVLHIGPHEILPNDKKYKIKPEYAEYKDRYNIASLNAVGEGLINICGEGGDLEKGDLIVTSSIPGKGMKQDDDIVRSYTVAKVRENVTFTDPTEVKLVACIYLCG